MCIVRCFGTEGRSPNVVPASAQVVPQQTFHRREIEELIVEESTPAAPAPAAPSYDSAVR